MAALVVALSVALVGLASHTSATTFDPQVTNGEDAAPDAHPFMVGLLHHDVPDDFSAQTCGGSLIHPEWVLTAAHCVVRDDGALEPSDLDLLLDTTDLGGSDGRRMRAADIVVHPDYDPLATTSDLALIRLPSAQPTETIAYATAADSALEAPGAMVTLIGWGGLTVDQRDDEQRYPTKLQEADVPVLPASECSGSGFETYDDATMVCAGAPEDDADGGVDACQGDSGGPLFSTSGGAATQIGIVSFGPTCGFTPTAYTRVSAFTEFIESTIGAGSGLPDGAVRYSGATRYATAAALATARWSGPLDHLYLVTGASFADALAVAPRARAEGAPILLTQRDALPAETGAALERLAPGAVTIVGGPSAVSDAVANEVAAVTGAEVSRIAGADRYRTASAIAALTGALPPDDQVVFVASGESFADALGGAAAAAAAPSTPLLLTARHDLPDPTAEQLLRLEPDTVFVLGGTGVITDAVLQEIEALGPEVVRLAGASRYETAARVATSRFDAADELVIATGTAFADGLVAAALGVPVLLVPSPDVVPREVTAAVSALGPSTLVIMGGTGAVSDAQAMAVGAAA